MWLGSRYTLSGCSIMERHRFCAPHEVELLLRRSPPGTKFIYHIGLLSRDKSGRPDLSRISTALFRLSGAHPLLEHPTQRRTLKLRTETPFVILTQRRTTSDLLEGCDYMATICRYALPGEIERAFVWRI